MNLTQEDMIMENNFDAVLNGVLEKIARGYSNAKSDWSADRMNPFKDGKFLGYYEAKEAIMKVLNAEGPVAAAVDEIKRRYNTVKNDWLADKMNPFKDGRFLAYFEVLNLLPTT